MTVNVIYDLLRHGHLPKMDRTRAQVKLGVSESSQLEHLATRLVYLNVHDQRDVPDRFHYIGLWTILVVHVPYSNLL